MNQRWMLLITALTFNVYADSNAKVQGCEIKITDLTQSMQSINQEKIITLSELIDPNSEEPIRRYILSQSDGSLIIVEQKHCMMYNVTVTFLLPENVGLNTVPGRLASILKETVVWKKWFNHVNVEEILKNEFKSKRIKAHINQMGSISYNLNDKIETSNESSESHLRLMNIEADTLPFNQIFSIYIGVGGM